jgi:hypothetical protein
VYIDCPVIVTVYSPVEACSPVWGVIKRTFSEFSNGKVSTVMDNYLWYLFIAKNPSTVLMFSSFCFKAGEWGGGYS